MRMPIRTPARPMTSAPSPGHAVRPAVFLACAAALLLAACGDDPAFDEVGGGGGAGDADEDAATLAPFVGTYDLTGPWRGTAGDEAYLVVREPDPSGKSTAALYDVDEIDNCYERPRGGALGTVRVDAFGTGVFLDGLFSFEEASVSLGAGNALTLDYTDAEDADRDGDTGERVRYVAPRNDGLAEADLEPLC